MENGEILRRLPESRLGLNVKTRLDFRRACFTACCPAVTTRVRLLYGHCAAQSSPSQFHRQKRGDGKNVAGDMSDLDATESGGRKSRLEQIAHLPGGSASSARIKLFDRFKCSEALRCRVLHRTEIIIGEQSE